MPEILLGKKNITWRINDEKDLKNGDNIKLVNWNSGQEFGKAEIVQVNEKKLGEISDEDFEGHEEFKNHQERLETYRKYYGREINDGSIVKIIKFKLIK